MTTVNLAFECLGEQHPGRPLLVLHGFFASGRNWRGLARQLAVRRRVYLLDMRNHGLSPQAALMDYPSMAADVLQFMDTQQIAVADLLGHSMGGKIAMWLALQASPRIGHLIIADIAPVTYSHNFDNTVQALRDLPLHSLTNRKQAETSLAAAIPDLSYRQFLLQNLVLEQGQYRWRVNLDYFQTNGHFIVGFPEPGAGLIFQRPVLFLSGEASGYIRPEAIYRYFPLAEIVELAGTGHWLHVDAPEQFLALLEAHLS